MIRILAAVIIVSALLLGTLAVDTARENSANATAKDSLVPVWAAGFDVASFFPMVLIAGVLISVFSIAGVAS